MVLKMLQNFSVNACLANYFTRNLADTWLLTRFKRSVKKVLRKAILHILMIIVILDTTSLCQVFKLPSLVQHFTEHKALNKEISFLDFLSMHYWGDDMDDDDDEKDMQLPFKKIDLQQSAFLFIPVSTSFIFDSKSWTVSRDYHQYKPQVHYNSHIGSLFRPPQV
jgi:hypothetical protein